MNEPLFDVLLYVAIGFLFCVGIWVIEQVTSIYRKLNYLYKVMQVLNIKLDEIIAHGKQQK